MTEYVVTFKIGYGPTQQARFSSLDAAEGFMSRQRSRGYDCYMVTAQLPA